MQTETFGLKIPITEDARRYAEKFAAEQKGKAKRAKVYLNTLAVCAVHNFLKIVQIETDLENSSAWNPIERLCYDIADLFIPHIDISVECRPVLPDQEEITLPPEVRRDRLGYVFVRFDNDLQEAELLGFLSIMDPDDDFEDLELEELEPLENFLTVLERVEYMSQVYDDPVFAKVEECLNIKSRLELVLQLEKIHRMEPHYSHTAKATAVFYNYRPESNLATASRSKEKVNDFTDEELEQLRELGDLAEALMEKLAQVLPQN
ncbi:MAG: DUF1822 family protein [Trichodesmium sp. ALOHA_ZT_67]|nr:DUF1822 family protein [Trichodesmium sp. ALOHA_ZT_67]